MKKQCEFAIGHWRVSYMLHVIIWLDIDVYPTYCMYLFQAIVKA